MKHPPLSSLLTILSIVIILAAWSGSQTGMIRAYQGDSTATLIASSEPASSSVTPSATSTVMSTATSTITSTNTTRPTPSDTPQPLIRASDYQNLFPVGMAFNLNIAANLTDIKSVKIHIYQPITNINITNEVDHEKHLLQGGAGSTFAGYLWKFDLSQGPAPIPFDPVYFDWEVTTTDGRVATAKYKGIFQDTLDSPDMEAAIWQSLGDPPLHFYTHNKTLALDIIRSGAKLAYEKVAADTGIQRNLNIIIYDSGVDYCLRDNPLATKDVTAATATTPQPTRPYVIWTGFKERVDCDPTLGDLIYQIHKFVVIHRNSLLLDQLQDQVISLIVGDAYAIYWQNTNQPPAWFRGGLVQLYSIAPRPYTLTLARDASRQGQLLPLTALDAFPNQLGGDQVVRLWNAESYLLTLYLASRYGADTPFKLAKALDQNTTFEAALDKIAGITPDGLFTDWQKWVLTDAAENALRWTPYLDTTPTPSSTPSPQPTRTQTLSPAQIPTRTPFPSNTPIPTPPTNTPLPPGSLRTRTPTPAPSASNTGSCPGSVALLLVPIGAVIFRGRRSKSSNE